MSDPVASSRSCLRSALAAGVVLGLVDVTLGVLRTDLPVLTARELFDPLALGVVGGAAACTLLAWLASRARGARLEPAVRTTAVLAALAVFVLVSGASDAASALERRATAGLLAVVTGVLVARARLALDSAKLGLIGALLFETLALLVAVRVRRGLAVALPPWIPIVVYALLVPATLHVWRSDAWRRRCSSVGVALFLLIVALPFAARASALVRGSSRATASESASPRVARVVLIVVDTLRADALSYRSGSAPPTPAIDALAARSLDAARAWAPAPWTLPSIASLMTGVSPLVHRATGPDSQLPSGLTTLAEHFAAAGYATAAIGHNPFLLPRARLQRGFADYRMRPDPSVELRCTASALLHAVRGAPPGESLDAAALTDEALAWVDAHRADPFFLWLHYYDAHVDYAPTPEFLPRGPRPPGMTDRFGSVVDARTGVFAPTPAERRWIRALYDGEVRVLDREIGRFLAGLEAAGLFDDALVVLTSDHGEEFWEHGGFEHGHAFHEELLHVPLLMKLPGGATRRELVEPVTLVGLAPTLLTMCALPFDASRLGERAWLDVDGAPVSSADERALVAGGNLYFEPRVALRFGDTKYVRGSFDGEEALFDLARDPREQRSLHASEPALLAEARRRHDAALLEAESLRRRNDVRSGMHAPLSDRQQELLRGGGYFEFDPEPR